MTHVSYHHLPEFESYNKSSCYGDFQSTIPNTQKRKKLSFRIFPALLGHYLYLLLV